MLNAPLSDNYESDIVEPDFGLLDELPVLTF